ncbi:MAG: hypothetical protein JO347_01310 [Candidatus Eremiobacteraeota bacterium]|nr:hypothetical protein [Candidatus Eremiobacteraeota bacterium]
MLVGSLSLGALETAVVAAQDKPKNTAVAQAPSSVPAPRSVDARALGIGEALLDFCATNDSEGAAKVRTRLKELTQGASKQALAEARRSTEYRSAHDSEADFIGKIDPHNAHRLCSAPPPGTK